MTCRRSLPQYLAFDSFGPFSLDDAAIMAFWGNTGTKTGLVLRVDDTPTYNAIMVSGTAFMIDTAGGHVLSNGTVNTWSFSSTFSAPVLNNLRAVAFWATLTVSSEGLFLDEEAAADLVVTQILAPVRVRRNTHITVTAKIKNEGTSAGAPNTIQAQFIKSDLTTAMGNAGSTPSTSSLDNGKTRSVKVRVRVPPPAANDCPCYVKVDADARSATPELSETNNGRNSSTIQIR